MVSCVHGKHVLTAIKLAGRNVVVRYVISEKQFVSICCGELV